MGIDLTEDRYTNGRREGGIDIERNGEWSRGGLGRSAVPNTDGELLSFITLFSDLLWIFSL